MTPSRLYRALSAFNHSTRRWVTKPLRNAESQSSHKPTLPNVVNKQTLSLVSWNINAFSSRPVARSKHILDYILEGPVSPDIIFFQEVSDDVRKSLLDNATVRSGFLVTDAEDTTSFDGLPFATMTLLSKKRFATDPGSQLGGDGMEGQGRLMLEAVFRLKIPSQFGRDGLCVDMSNPAASGSVLRLINVHLDSLDTFHWRNLQMKALSDVLHEPGRGRGIIAGDFNANNPGDGGLIDKYGLVDAWVSLHGRKGPEGATWGVGMKLRDGRKPGRFDKVAMLGLTAEAMEVLPTGLIEVTRPAEPSLYEPWSDHYGLRCTVSI